MTPQKILIDTDLGDDIDDVLAIAFALLRPELDVIGITTVNRDTTKRAAIAAKLLKVMGRDDVPVAPGMQIPLRPFSTQERRNWMSATGEPLNHYPWVESGESLPPIEKDAIDLMARLIFENPGEVVLVGIGPFTNLAALLNRHPGVADKLKGINIMGGELQLERNEHNIAVDPVSSDILFNSGVPIFMGSWAVTRGFVLSPEDCDFIAHNAGPLGAELKKPMDLWWPWKAAKIGPVMYDLAPILWAFDRGYHEVEAKRVKVELEDPALRGRTLAIEGEPNAEVTVSMRDEAVHALYMETICSTH